MNFLAHLVLSAHDEEEMLGNLLGDFTKRIDVFTLPPAMQKGIRLHRAIDRFTDFHPIVSISKERVSDDRWRFAGVLVDVFYDHFLARDFADYHDEALRSFIDRVYDALLRRRSLLPPHVSTVLDRMIEQDWIGCYDSIPGISLTLERIARRLSRPTNLSTGVVELEHAYDMLRKDFTGFWPQLRQYVDAQRNTV